MVKMAFCVRKAERWTTLRPHQLPDSQRGCGWTRFFVSLSIFSRGLAVREKVDQVEPLQYNDNAYSIY